MKAADLRQKPKKIHDEVPTAVSGGEDRLRRVTGLTRSTRMEPNGLMPVNRAEPIM